MGKLGEHTKCPKCAGEMTLVIERETNGDPKWKGWVCGNPTCNHKTEESFPDAEGVYGEEVFPGQSKKTGQGTGS